MINVMIGLVLNTKLFEISFLGKGIKLLTKMKEKAMRFLLRYCQISVYTVLKKNFHE